MFSIINLKFIALILIIFIIVSVVVVFMTTPQTQSPSQQIPTQSVSPTSYPNLNPSPIPPSAPIDNTFNSYTPEYLEEQQKVTEQEQPLYNKALIVSEFTDKLPFTGQYIKVSYNIYNNQIYLEYDKNNKDQALAEFVNLLKQNRIENINWLYNLSILEK
jgi:PBP1b-binding outer membrane lipoprotein LpoB